MAASTVFAVLRESTYTLIERAVPFTCPENGNASPRPAELLSALDSRVWSPKRTELAVVRAALLEVACFEVAFLDEVFLDDALVPDCFAG
jgi:hypothetical protein